MDDSDALTPDALRGVWPVLSEDERVDGFTMLAGDDAMEFFLELTPRGQSQLVRNFAPARRQVWLRLLAPDDAADLIQQFDPPERPALIAMLDEVTRREVTALLAYSEDDAGGLMSPRFARVRPEMTVGEAVRYLRRQARLNIETLYYGYVLDDHQRLLGVVSFRELFQAQDEKPVREMMKTDLVTVRDTDDQERVARVIAQYDLLAVPVLDASGAMKGIVTVDDVVDVVQQEATEDIQKLGGTEALDAPYLQVGFFSMVKKRAGWLAILFVGEMLTTSAMAHYQDELKSAIVLAMFLPLIISSGGNSGSQATTLVIRALALGQLRLQDWWRVLGREIRTGLALGIVLGIIGAIRIAVWRALFPTRYGPEWISVLITVAASVVGVVLLGSLTGAMLPFILRRLKLDPASASAPFVATLVDVSGLVLYFTVASLVLGSRLV